MTTRYSVTVTPWGISQDRTPVAPGIEFHSTASHGGYALSPERQAELPEWAPKRTWYEEDCEWAFVAIAFPQFFPERAIPVAWKVLERFYPAAYLAARKGAV